MNRLVALLLACTALAACSPHAPTDSAATSATAPAAATTNALAGTPMATYGHALNKAKNVQNIVDDQARQQSRAIDDATGGGH